MLARSREDRNHTQAQAQPTDTTDHVLKLMSALKARVVVELSVSRQTVLPPVFNQAFQSEIRGNCGVGPRSFKAAMQRGGVQNSDINTARYDEIFDDVE